MHTPARHFLSLDLKAWKELMLSWGETAFRATQVHTWISQRLVSDPALMSNLPQALRDRLHQELRWELPEVVSTLASEDGSTKLLFKSQNGYIESVLMRYAGRTSLCVSSQVGCRLACSFCQTGKLGFVRHLAAEEILAQYFCAARIAASESRRLSHVVFMGMGEPLDNYDAVVFAVQQLTSQEAYGLSHKNVTVSTSGLAPRILSLSGDARAALAVSLHAARDDLRTELMPINRRYSLAALKEALLSYQKTTGDKITLEYILIKDKNCGTREAKELVRFIHGLRVKVNLIPFNSHPGMPYQRPDDETIRAFQKYLAERSIPAPVRYSKGLDVSAACGQLAAKKVEQELHTAPERERVLTRSKPSLRAPTEIAAP